MSDNPSGENVVVDAEVAALQGAGLDVDTYIRSSDEIKGMGQLQRAQLPVAPTWSPRAVKDVSAQLERRRPDVLHLHNPYPLISPGVLRAAAARGVPVVQTLHNYRHVCLNGLRYRDGHLCDDCPSSGTPLPGVVHACYRGSRAQSAAQALSLVTHRATFREVAAYLALNPVMAEELRAVLGPHASIEVRPNTVPDPGPGQRRDDHVLFAGRLSAEKGLELLLDAWSRRRSSGTPLVVAGDGPLRGLVERSAERRDDVRFVGQLSRPQMEDHLRRAAFLVVPSVWHEVCPMVVVEALALGVPVLVTAVGGLPWLIGGAGWVSPPDAPALARALDEALGDPAGRRTRSAAARERYERSLSPEETLRQLLAVYERVSSAASAAKRA